MKLIRLAKKCDLDDEEKFQRKLDNASKRFGSIYVDFELEDDEIWESIYTNEDDTMEFGGELEQAEKKLKIFAVYCEHLKKAISYAKKKKEQLNKEWQELS